MFKHILIALTLAIGSAACAADFLDDDEIGDEELMTDEDIAAEVESLSDEELNGDFLAATTPQACVMGGATCYLTPTSPPCCSGYYCRKIVGTRGFCSPN